MSDSPYIVGIGGGTGAGKTTVAETVTESVDAPVTFLSLDDYYRDSDAVPTDDRGKRNFDHPDAVDWDLFVEHLATVASFESVQVPRYDFETHSRRSETRRVDPDPIVIVEGIFALFHEEVLALLDLAVYVQTDADVRVLRRLRRDVSERGRTVESVVERYLATVKPMHEQFVEPTKRDADVIIPEGANPAAIDLLREKVETEVDARERSAGTGP
ncbi:MAG: uridine kinase [Haloarculaceae archaeon]